MIRLTTQLILDEFKRRGHAIELLNEEASLMRYYLADGSVHLLKSCLSDMIPATALMIANDKLIAGSIAQECGLPVLPSMSVPDAAAQAKFLAEQGKVVVKPHNAGHGHGITVGISDPSELLPALGRARVYSQNFVIQKHVTGYDSRVLVINYALAAATRRTPASVTGDGASTVAELVENENTTNPDRGASYSNKLNFIDVNAARLYLGERYDSYVPDAGRLFQVVGVSNIGAGGTAEDITSTVSPAMVQDAVSLAKYLSMPMCAVDFMVDQETGAHYFIEVNATPSFGLHEYPAIGEPQPVTRLYADWLLQGAVS